MADVDLRLEDLEKLFPAGLTQDQINRGKTILLKELALDLHKYYGGKMITVPKAGIYGFNWFNIWYTPGVSQVSTAIRDDNDASFELSNRGNLVAVVSDSTRVLGDGDCTPPGGLGVMEGKAFLMKYLGGVDAVALCINSYNDQRRHDPGRIIEFVKMAEPSFGAVNLEDISQPNCYKVLDTLREACDIPVWHDDAQGTGCVTLAGLINALTVAGKKLGDARIVLYGAGASNTTIFRLITTDGGDPAKMVMFDTKGSLGTFREDIKNDPANYRKWEICQQSNPAGVKTMDEAMRGADVLIALSTPGPDVIKPEWIRTMADKSIVFVCANPVPEIYPYAAKQAGAFIVATGRGDFPNQVNNVLGFPGILKGALLVRARKITDGMAIAAAHSLAAHAARQGLSPDNIIPRMSDAEVFPAVARDVAMQAIRDGVARVTITADQAFRRAGDDIREARAITDKMMELGLIKRPPAELIAACVKRAVAQVK
ncbi:MAG TPA: NADP-dependent malic enzyme [Candidatus Edwardsbacteria bacterium]|nr:NADP-dependent malic enzyme [Candidatus Edwardsbacteria bacterium]